MKIYILADMEGISGIRRMEQVKSEHPGDYEEGRKLMLQEINVCVDGAFAGGASEVRVNSLHGQGVERLGDGLTVEARAPDGLIEAISATDARAFTLGVQWHPEWKHASDALSTAIFRAFGAACRDRMHIRTGSAAAASANG